jgi:hypothetical protein
MASTFTLTTSIVPANIPPIGTKSSVYTSENNAVSFQLQGFDPDETGPLKAMFLSMPFNGTLSVPLFTWLPFEETFIYTPNENFYGTDVAVFVLNDGKDNSTVAFVQFVVEFVNQPPTPVNSTFDLLVGANISYQLNVIDADSLRQNLSFYLASSPEYGNAKVSVEGDLFYQATDVGTEFLYWQVQDESGSFYTGNVTIVITDGKGPVQGLLSTGQVAGVVIGSMALIGLLGLALVYFLYMYVAAAKFQKTVPFLIGLILVGRRVL